MSTENPQTIKEGRVNPRVLMIGPGLEGGGAEKRFSLMAKYAFGGTAHTFVVNDHRVNAGLEIGTIKWLALKVRYFMLIRRVRAFLCAEPAVIAAGFGCFPNLILGLASRFLSRCPRLVFFEITRPESASRIVGTSRIVTALQRAIYPKADAVVCNSIDGASECVRYFGIDAERVKIVPNLIEIDTVITAASQPLSWTRPRDRIVAVYHGRLVKSKRTDLIIGALGDIPKPQRPFLLIVGTGPEEDRLRQIVGETGLTSDVLFTGWTQNPYHWIAQADLYLFASEYEGFSNSVLEAMALGLPVLTSVWGSDAVDLERRGAVGIIDPTKTSETARKIVELAVNSEAQVTLGKRGKAIALEHDYHSSLESYESVLRGR